MYKWRDELTRDITEKRTPARRWGFISWPTSIVGWLRIPSLIAGISGLLGILRYSSPHAFRLLKPLNLPSIEFCWVMLALAVVVYLICMIGWLTPRGLTRPLDKELDDAKKDTVNTSTSPMRWRGI